MLILFYFGLIKSLLVFFKVVSLNFISSLAKLFQIIVFIELAECIIWLVLSVFYYLFCEFHMLSSSLHILNIIYNKRHKSYIHNRLYICIYTENWENALI